MAHELPPLPQTPSREGIFPGPHGFSNKDMWAYGEACWNAAIDAALECSGDSVINGFISELYLHACKTASNSAE